MLCCVLPLLLLGAVRRLLHVDGREAPAMPPPARRGVDLDRAVGYRGEPV